MPLIEQLEKTLRIDTDRICVTGLSMGGYGSWHLAKLIIGRNFDFQGWVYGQAEPGDGGRGFIDCDDSLSAFKCTDQLVTAEELRSVPDRGSVGPLLADQRRFLGNLGAKANLVIEYPARSRDFQDPDIVEGRFFCIEIGIRPDGGQL
jgi:hypothetical protein